MNIKLNNNQNKFLFLHKIAKEEIETQNIERINKVMKILRKDLKHTYNTLMIMFDGYNDDSREIYEIQEIRNYVRKTFNENKDLFYYLTDIDNNNKILLACMSDFKSIKKENDIMVKTQYNLDDELKKEIVRGIISCVKYDKDMLKKAIERTFD